MSRMFGKIGNRKDSNKKAKAKKNIQNQKKKMNMEKQKDMK